MLVIEKMLDNKIKIKEIQRPLTKVFMSFEAFERQTATKTTKEVLRQTQESQTSEWTNIGVDT